MWRAQSDARIFGAIVIGLALCGWLALAIASAAGGRAGFSHEALTHAPLELSGSIIAGAGVFLLGWLLMTAAMMLPTTLPLVMLFGGFTAHRRGRGILLSALLCGYLAVWLAFGAVAYAVDLGIHRFVDSHAWLHQNAWLLLAMPLVVAGVYQFTPLKYRCLDKCRSPYSFIVEQWHGRRPRVEALRVGWTHGLFCLGCCWSLMLLMFAVSAASLTWMVALAIVMGVEKNLSWGRGIAAPVGVVLLIAGLTVVATNALSPG